MEEEYGLNGSGDDTEDSLIEDPQAASAVDEYTRIQEDMLLNVKYKVRGVNLPPELSSDKFSSYMHMQVRGFGWCDLITLNYH